MSAGFRSFIFEREDTGERIMLLAPDEKPGQAAIQLAATLQTHRRNRVSIDSINGTLVVDVLWHDEGKEEKIRYTLQE